MSSRDVPTPTTRPARRANRTAREDTVAFWAFVTPLLAGLLVFTFLPLVWGFLLSLGDARVTVSIGRWVGLENYRALLTDAAFLDSLKTVGLFTLFIVPTTLLLALTLALLVQGARSGQGFFRSVFFLPTAVSYVVASLVWKMGIFSGVSYGLVNKALLALGHDTVAWTFSSPAVWVVLVTVRLWLGLGFNMLLFIAGLNEIPRALYEAARIDGAEGGWATFRFITLPLLRNTIIFVLFTNVVSAVQGFDEFYNLLYTTGGSGVAASLHARPPLLYLYDAAFTAQDYGRATAGSFILAALILLVTLIQVRVFGLGRTDD